MLEESVYWSSEMEISVSVPSLSPNAIPVMGAVWERARPMYTKEASCSTWFEPVPIRCGVETGLLLALPKGNVG